MERILFLPWTQLLQNYMKKILGCIIFLAKVKSFVRYRKEQPEEEKVTLGQLYQIHRNVLLCELLMK